MNRKGKLNCTDFSKYDWKKNMKEKVTAKRHKN